MADVAFTIFLLQITFRWPAIVIAVVLWSAILAYLALPLALRGMRVRANVREKIIRVAAPSTVWMGLFLALGWLYRVEYGTSHDLFGFSVGYARARLVYEWCSLSDPVYLILAIGGAAVALVHFGLPGVLGLAGISTERGERAAALATGALITVLMVASLSVEVWARGTAAADPEGLQYLIESGYIVRAPLWTIFAPLNLVLTVRLPRLLRKTGEERARIARHIVVAMVVLGLIGGVMSALSYKYW